LSRIVRATLHGRADGKGLSRDLRTACASQRGAGHHRACAAMNEEAIRVSDQFYILAKSARIDDRTRVLKHGDTFAVFDRFGDIDPFGPAELGIYHGDTRYLSR